MVNLSAFRNKVQEDISRCATCPDVESISAEVFLPSAHMKVISVEDKLCSFLKFNLGSHLNDSAVLEHKCVFTA